MDQSAGDEVFDGLLVGHIELIGVFFRDQKQKSSKRVGSCRTKDGDKRAVDCIFDLFCDLAGLKPNAKGRTLGKRDHDGMFKSFFSIHRKKSSNYVSACFVNCFN